MGAHQASLLLLFFGALSTGGTTVNREKRQAGNAPWNNNSGNWGGFGGSTPPPISSTRSWDANNYNNNNNNRGGWSPPINNMFNGFGFGHGPGPGGPRFGVNMMPSNPPQPPQPPQPPSPSSPTAPQNWPASGNGGGPPAGPGNGGPMGGPRGVPNNQVPNTLLQGLSALMRSRLRSSWANRNNGFYNFNAAPINHNDPIYRQQAHAAGDKFTVNPAPVQDANPGGTCPPGVIKMNCVYNPCPRCRDPNIRCWTNMCGGCNEEMYRFGQRVLDCENI